MASQPIRPYQEQKCKQLVLDKYHDAIKSKFGAYVHLCFRSLYDWDDYCPDTPRLRTVSGQIPCASFYYTEFLVELEPDTIYDMGCGMNFFKNILPNVIGIDGHGEHYDINDIFDQDFVSGHRGAFKAVMSIDAMHFVPLTDFQQRVLDFSSLVAPGGRGYLAMNVARMWERLPTQMQERFSNNENPDLDAVIEYVDSELDSTGLNFLVRENLIATRWDEFLDGNIRLVFEK